MVSNDETIYFIRDNPSSDSATTETLNIYNAKGFHPTTNDDATYSFNSDTYTEYQAMEKITKIIYQGNNIVELTDDNETFTFTCSLNTFAICFCTNNISSSIFEIHRVVAPVMVYDTLNSKWVGLPVPAINGYTGQSSTSVDSSRNLKGKVVGNVVRSDIAKIELKWNYLDSQTYSDMAKLFEVNLGGAFYVKVCFFNVIINGFDAGRTFYPNDRKANYMEITTNKIGVPVGYKGVSLNLIEV